ncbi:hypothetical protein D9611_007371 [Ephemerocybe angulata]|uniref:HAT C-terminal dimerisation domain-containing protein n=1 Tax=Ephemerocybe angulata TaxID=980116 RepID=A0A8H5FL30_9AGAR|nr:hypothetical protein D9611_007371 [Tulosesus angulatus]
MELPEDWDKMKRLLTKSQKPSKTSQKKEVNMFDSLPTIARKKKKKLDPSNLEDEIMHYLAEPVDDECEEEPLEWWVKCQKEYPWLSRMAWNFLSIPATSVDVERVFSKGQILISHLRNRLLPQTICSLLCLHYWSLAGYVKDCDVVREMRRPAVDGEEDTELDDDWDRIA